MKVSPSQAMEAHGDVNARDHIHTVTALERGRVANPSLSRLYPRGKPWNSFCRRLNGPQGKSRHEGVKKNVHPCDTRNGIRAVIMITIIIKY